MRRDDNDLVTALFKGALVRNWRSDTAIRIMLAINFSNREKNRKCATRVNNVEQPLFAHVLLEEFRAARFTAREAKFAFNARTKEQVKIERNIAIRRIVMERIALFLDSIKNAVGVIHPVLDFSRLNDMAETSTLTRDKIHRGMATGTHTRKIREINTLVHPGI